MKQLIFTPGRVGPLPTYLSYFFLRFPGSLGPEESWDLTCFDTYDRRWARQGQLWVNRADKTVLVEPPSLLPLEDDVSSFGLQKPLVVGRVSAKVRGLEFLAGEKPALGGQLVTLRRQSFLVLRGKFDARWTALVDALVADGLQPYPSETAFALVRSRGAEFVGPTPAPVMTGQDLGASYLLDRIADGLRVARQYEKGVRDDVDTECLHQYRVGLRRVRSLASLGRMWELLPEWNRLRFVLRTLQQETNELRDLDVLLLDLPALQSALPWDEGPRLEGWAASLKQRRQAEHRRVKAWLASEAHAFASREVDKLLADLAPLGEPWSVTQWASSAFSRSARSLKKSLRALGDAPLDAALHQVRIEAKRLRYVLESLGGFGPSSVKGLLTTLKEAQEGLGQFQDRSILLERLKKERTTLRGGKAAVDTLTFGILLGQLIADQQVRREQALIDSQRLQSKPFQKALQRLVAPPEASDEP